MSRTYTAPPPPPPPHQNTSEASLSAILASHLHQQQQQQHQHQQQQGPAPPPPPPPPPPSSMDGRQADYSQSGLHSPYAPYHGQQPSESSPADQSSAVQYPPGGQDYKPSSTFSSSATPTSEYGLPQSARSGSFPEYIQRSYTDGQNSRYPNSAQGAHTANMAQTSSPSLSMAPDGRQPNGHAPQHGNSHHSNGDVPIDPSIAQSSPTYQQQHSYSPYPPQHELPQYQSQPMYARPDWASQYGQPMQYGQAVTSAGGAPNMSAHAIPRPPPGGHPLSTVYSFVPIPGAQQHKRPRRRYEEIERMYKCGWNGCEKAYGTLNHLNAHVTMQSHGTKRTPEEFKEIRKEWKAKKKEEDNQRKAEEERQRQEAASRVAEGGSQAPQGQPGQYGQPHMMAPQLPPIGYQPAAGQPDQYQQPGSAQQYASNGSMYGAQGYPQSPYAQGGLPYQQHGEQAPSKTYRQQ